MHAPTIITRPEVEIDQKLLAEIKTLAFEQGQVVVHCLFVGWGVELIRIWPTTYLFDLHSEHRSELVHFENITLAPQWSACAAGPNFFTLIFSGLPKACQVFDLVENCQSENGAFEVRSISRNEQDVYFVRL